MKDVLISVILPVYNGEQTIIQTVSSVLNQSFKNFELIIINDGSIDGTHKICRSIAKKDNRIIYELVPNGGVSNARNLGLSLASGKYVVFIDSDDLYHVDYLKELFVSIEEGFELVVCGYKNFGLVEKEFTMDDKVCFEHKSDYISYLQSKFLFNQIWNKIYNLNIIKKNEILFSNSISIAEDLKFNLEYIDNISNIKLINECLYNYRVTDSGLGFRYRPEAGYIKLKLCRYMEEIFDKDNNNLLFVYQSYIIQYFSLFSSILDKRNQISFKKKIFKFKEILNSDDYTNDLKKCKVDSIKYKVLLWILKSKSIILLVPFSFIANRYDKYNKSINFGL